MCKSDIQVRSTRRKFLQSTGTFTVGVTAISSQPLLTDVFAAAKEPKVLPKPQNILDPQAALARLMAGNSRYVEGVSRRHDFRHEREALVSGQNPYATLLSCADSRIAPEYAFDSARGDIFAVRVAGNFVSDYGLGSLEYAVEVLKSPVLMVLGHDGCGAVNAAVKVQTDGATYPGHIQTIAQALLPPVQKVIGKDGDLLDNAVRQNVIDNVDKLKSISEILSAAVEREKLIIIGGIYRLATGKVELVTKH